MFWWLCKVVRCPRRPLELPGCAQQPPHEHKKRNWEIYEIPKALTAAVLHSATVLAEGSSWRDFSRRTWAESTT
eukprot:s1774_g9.t1